VNLGAGASLALIEDDADVRRSLSRLLRSAGFEVSAFDSVEDYLLSGSSPASQCMLVDVGLPGLSGPELCGLLARSGAIGPLVLLSGWDDDGRTATLPGSAHVEFVAKPCLPEVLIGAIARAIASGLPST
jgi:FixJ family two-component response regulator